MKLFSVFIFGLLLSLSCLAQSRENTSVSFTLADRDRIMRTEQKLDAFQKSVDERFASLENSINERFVSLENSINERFESTNERFVSLEKRMNDRFISLEESINMRFEAQQKQLDHIYTLLFFVLGAIMSLIGFVIYDRRTAIKPVQQEQENIIRVLRKYSEKNNDLSEILKNAGML